jgi:HEAT repeat protein
MAELILQDLMAQLVHQEVLAEGLLNQECHFQIQHQQRRLLTVPLAVRAELAAGEVQLGQQAVLALDLLHLHRWV